MNVIGTDGQFLRDMIVIDGDASLGRLRLDDLKHIGDRTIDADLAQGTLVGAQEAAQMPYDLTGARVVLADIGENFPELVNIRRAFREQYLGGPGIVEDGSQRLV